MIENGQGIERMATNYRAFSSKPNFKELEACEGLLALNKSLQKKHDPEMGARGVDDCDENEKNNCAEYKETPPFITGQREMTEILSHERLNNESLCDEINHSKQIVYELKMAIRTKNQYIQNLEERCKFLENEQKYINQQGDRVDSSVMLLDKVEKLYKDEIEEIRKDLDKINQEQL